MNTLLNVRAKTVRNCMALIGMLISTGYLSIVNAELIDHHDGTVYDNVLNITWLQDANYANTSGFRSGGYAPGRMGWADADSWTGQLNIGGHANWHLPTAGQLRHLNRSTLNNPGYREPGWSQYNPNYNSGPFTSIAGLSPYWGSGATGVGKHEGYNMRIAAGIGSFGDSLSFYVWPVHNGNVAITITTLSDSIIINENTSVQFDPRINDSSNDGSGLTIISTSTPNNGDISYTPTRITYTPISDFIGQDKFTYTVENQSGHQNIGNIVVSVEPMTSSLKITFVPAVQAVNNDFSVTVEALRSNGARNESINDGVNIEADGIRLSHDSIACVAGVCTETGLQALSPSFITKLTASYNGLSISSDYFSVVDPNAVPAVLSVSVPPRDFFAYGDVVNVFLRNAVTNESLGPISLTYTQNGTYIYAEPAEFIDIPAGRYQLWATSATNPNITSRRDKFLFISNDRNANHLTVGIKLLDISKPPVLIVPGMLGSTTSSALGLYPKFKQRAHITFGDKDLKIFQGLGDQVGLDTLKDTLESVYSVYDVPWDWRVSTETAWEKYLAPVIELAKDPDGDGVVDFPQIDVIAHSLGGLMVRAYIQSPNYSNDIDKFAMLGTPNEGASNAYYLIEGGDPWRADADNSFILKDTYRETTIDLMELYNIDMFKSFFNWGECYINNLSTLGDLRSICTQEERKAANRLAIRKMYLSNVATGKQLMPTYKFLQHDDLQLYGIVSRQDRNDVLINLNSTVTASPMKPANTAAAGDVKTKIFISNDLPTPGVIRVTPNFNIHALYPDGLPWSSDKDGMKWSDGEKLGDGTVPTCSAANVDNIRCDTTTIANKTWSTIEIALPEDKKGGHGGLFGAFAQEVLGFLQEGPN